MNYLIRKCAPITKIGLVSCFPQVVENVGYYCAGLEPKQL